MSQICNTKNSPVLELGRKVVIVSSHDLSKILTDSSGPSRKVALSHPLGSTNLYALQTHPCVFPAGKTLFSLLGSQLMKTGFSLLGKSTQGNPCSGPVLTL